MSVNPTEEPLQNDDANHGRLFRTLSRIDREQQRPRWNSKPRRPWQKRLILSAEILLALILIAVITADLSLRHAMRASLPQLDGEVHIAGLSAPVTVTRDAQSVPSIRAANLDDLLFAQGYITASDRLWQMDALRRHAAGDLAEILGPSLVEHDRRQRTLQVRAAADRAISVLPREQLHQLDAYAYGVNAFIESHASALPMEFHLLHYKPAPWSPRDSLLIELVMTQDLSTEFPQKMNREALSARLPATLLSDLYPVGSWRDRPPTQATVDLTAPTDSIEQIPLDKTQSFNRAPSATPADLLKTFAALGNPCDNCRAGSNNWAVAGSRSASGAPLVSNDMHLGLTMPDIWYEAALHAAGSTPLDVTGFTLPGMPFVIAGRNEHIAWTYTNLGADVQDIRIEHLRGSGADTEFELPNKTWALAQHHIELIHVRGGRNVTLDVLTTTHALGNATLQTPVLSSLYPTDHRALSLSWTIYDPSTITAPLLDIDTASDAASLVAAFSSFACVSENVIYADNHSIGYHAIGRVPIRGLALQRPRAMPQFVMPDRTPEDDDQDESGTLAFPQTLGTPHLILASARRARAVTPKAQVEQIPQPAVLNYTVGSPISPLPTDALDETQEWSGYIPYSELPSMLNPVSGVLATANARVTSDNYPYFIANDWVDPYRAERIYRSLENRTGLTPADMLRLESDVHSEFDLMLAQRLAYAIDETLTKAHGRPLAQDAKQLHQAADILRDWKGDMSPDSSAAAIVSVTRARLWPALLVPQLLKQNSKRKASVESLILLYTWNEKTTALEGLLQHTPARWLPATYPNWNTFLASCVAEALKQVHAPADLAGFHYGSLHVVDIQHPILGRDGLFSRMLGVSLGSGASPIGGDNTTIKATGLHFGPSERFTADLANPDSTLGNITTGQSGNPASAAYLDQFGPWLHGTSFALPLNKPAIVHSLSLLPQ
jgi:penicillin amidase